MVVAALAQLGTLYVDLGRGQDVIEAAARMLALPRLNPAEERAAHRGLALGEMFVHGAPAGLARLAERLPQPADEVPLADVDLLVTRGTIGFYASRPTAAMADLRAGIRLARQAGVPQSLPRAHLQLAQLLVGAGEWDEALVHARLALSLVSDERRVWMEAQSHAVLGRLHACRGEWTQAQQHVDAATAAATALGTAEAVFTACIARATLARAHDDPRGVLAAFAPIVGGGPRPLPMATSLTWWPPLIAATADAGDTAAARAQLDRLRAAAEERGLDLRAQIVGLDALLTLREGDTAAAAAGFARAVALAGPGRPGPRPRRHAPALRQAARRGGQTSGRHRRAAARTGAARGRRTVPRPGGRRARRRGPAPTAARAAFPAGAHRPRTRRRRPRRQAG